MIQIILIKVRHELFGYTKKNNKANKIKNLNKLEKTKHKWFVC